MSSSGRREARHSMRTADTSYVPPPQRPRSHTEDSFSEVINAASDEVERALGHRANAQPVRVSARDLAVRDRSDSFDDAVTEILPASLATPIEPIPRASLSLQTPSLNPIVVPSRPPPRTASQSGIRKIPGRRAESKTPSGVWIIGLMTLGGLAAFGASLIAARPIPPSTVSAARPAEAPIPPPQAVEAPVVQTPAATPPVETAPVVTAPSVVNAEASVITGPKSPAGARAPVVATRPAAPAAAPVRAAPKGDLTPLEKLLAEQLKAAEH